MYLPESCQMHLLFTCCRPQPVEDDEFGYTPQQKAALIDFWSSKLQDNLEMHGKIIFIKFLEDYPEYYHIWNIPEDPIRLAENLPLHGQVALFALDRLIRDLGANPNAYKRNLKKIAEKHIALKIDDRSMERYINAIILYIKRKFKQEMYQDLEEGLDRFFNNFNRQFNPSAPTIRIEV